MRYVVQQEVDDFLKTEFIASKIEPEIKSELVRMLVRKIAEDMYPELVKYVKFDTAISPHIFSTVVRASINVEFK